jgi:hypothetical protein
VASNPKDIVGRLKPGLSNTPILPMFEIGKVMDNGAAKYGSYNWRSARISFSVYYNAALRHLARWWEGESLDTDSGYHHLAHVAANCIILLDAMACDRFDDDRPVISCGAHF